VISIPSAIPSTAARSSFADGKYYSAIGDHLAPQGNAFVFEYDPAKKALRQLADVRKIINLPAGHYTPGKIHSHVELGSDGWLYFSTHRGSTKVTTDANHYLGDWILRANPKTGEMLYQVRRGLGRPDEDDLRREVHRSVVVRLDVVAGC